MSDKQQEETVLDEIMAGTGQDVYLSDLGIAAAARLILEARREAARHAETRQAGGRIVAGCDTTIMGRAHLCDAWEQAVKERDAARTERDALRVEVSGRSHIQAMTQRDLERVERERDAALAWAKGLEAELLDLCATIRGAK